MSPQQLELFNKYSWLIFRVRKRYFPQCPDAYKDDLLQCCRIELAKSVLNVDGRYSDPGAYLWLNVRDAARGFLWGRKQYGNAAMRDSAQLECSLEDVIGREDGEDRTRLHLIESDQADREYQHGCARRHQESLLVQIAEALKTLPDTQRRVIELRFIEGLTREAISKKIGLSVPRVTCFQREGIRKLRVLLGNLDYRTLPETAPIPSDGGFERGSRLSR